MHFLDMPVEMLLYVVQFLPPTCILKLGMTCKHMWSVTNIESVWQKLCMKDYLVDSVQGWDLTYKDVYTKVLQRCNFLGWRRLALQPYGGLLHVTWSKGEIQVLKYQPRINAKLDDDLECVHLYSLYWDVNTSTLVVKCLQGPENGLPATLAQGYSNMEGPKYPVLKCSSNDCYKSHRPTFMKSHCQADKRFENSFDDLQKPFCKTFHKGSYCPMLPFPVWHAQDHARSPVKLGLYNGDYSSHGIEIIHLSFSPNESNILKGMKITGDPNVPAGRFSLYVDLNRPIVLSREEQHVTFNDLLAIEESDRDEERNDIGEQKQPFVLPLDSYDERFRSPPPKMALARYWGQGRIAGTFYRGPTFSRCHFMKFSDIEFGVLWLELNSFSMFHLVNGLQEV